MSMLDESLLTSSQATNRHEDTDVPRKLTARNLQIEQELDYQAAVANWLLDLSDSSLSSGAYNDAIQWIQLAADVLYSQNRDLSSPRMEASLRFLARLLPEPRERTQPKEITTKETCLHVLNEALAFGGHTAMATRWMHQDRESRIHSIALLNQRTPVSSELVQSVSATGGHIYIAEKNASLFERAAWLRTLACERATYVVLHIDVNDVIGALAFGIKGGPPTLLVNHAAHIFWVGSSVPDLVVNCRGSKLEEYWTTMHRGAIACATIPIPLTEPDVPTFSEAETAKRKSHLKESLGIPREATLILTVGASYKYAPIPGLDFLETCKDILRALPEVFVFAAGLNEDARWRAASEDTDFRLRALGSVTQEQLASLSQASDVYIEGFPFGSTTALLEAGLHGLPVVLTPSECPPPYGSDGVALDDCLARPSSIEEYKAQIVRLCRKPFEREAVGRLVRHAIVAHHTGGGWSRYLANALRVLPPAHRIHPIGSPLRTPAASYRYWCEFRQTWTATNQSLLEDYILRALSCGLRPKITKAMETACTEARQVRAGRAIPLPVLVSLCNHVLPHLPNLFGRSILRIAEFLFRQGRLRRLLRGVRRFLNNHWDTPSPSHQYRTPQSSAIGRETPSSQNGSLADAPTSIMP